MPISIPRRREEDKGLRLVTSLPLASLATRVLDINFESARVASTDTASEFVPASNPGGPADNSGLHV
jgi:hypothetical protein